MLITTEVRVDITALTDRQLDELAQEIETERRRREPPPVVLADHEKCLIKGGHIVYAIRSVRERCAVNGVKPSLRQCKDAVDAYRDSIGMRYDAATGQWRAP